MHLYFDDDGGITSEEGEYRGGLRDRAFAEGPAHFEAPDLAEGHDDNLAPDQAEANGYHHGPKPAEARWYHAVPDLAQGQHGYALPAQQAPRTGKATPFVLVLLYWVPLPADPCGSKQVSRHKPHSSAN